MAAEALSLGQVGRELAGFLAFFAIFGALGFYFFVLRRTPGLGPSASGPFGTVFAAAESRAARVGLMGSVLFLILSASNLANNRDHLPFLEALTKGGARTATPLVCGVVLLLAFALSRLPGAWVVGGLAGLVLALRNVVTGRWVAMVNPLHELGGALWIGSLFVLLVAGLPAILRSSVPADRRGPLVADLVARFSNLALGAAGLLGVTGVITAWRHLKYVAALWTTAYGYAFDAKMLCVLIVAGLGAWNWRRMRPRLRSEGAVEALQLSAARELVFAGVVLVITAMLVSLPVPGS
jgi:putative copper export protein